MAEQNAKPDEVLDKVAEEVSGGEPGGGAGYEPSDEVVEEPAPPTEEPVEEPPKEPESGESEDFDWFSALSNFQVPPVQPQQSQVPPQVPPVAAQPTQPQPQGEPQNDWDALVNDPAGYVKNVASQVAAQVAAQQAAVMQQQMAMQMALQQVQRKYGEKFDLLRNFAAQRLSMRGREYASLANNPGALVSKLFADAEKDAIAQAKMLHELQQRSSGAAAAAAASGAAPKRKPRAKASPTGDVPDDVRRQYQKAVQEGDMDAMLSLIMDYPQLEAVTM